MLSRRAQEMQANLDALDRSQAVIEFKMDGSIIRANQNFLSVLGYDLHEIVGRSHSMFVDPDYRTSEEYRCFWEALRRGDYQSGEYKRLRKDGQEVWIQASYNPIMDRDGRPVKVVKFASDVTRQKLRSANAEGQLKALDRSQAVIEFQLDGTIITANKNFLDAVGYGLHEIKGRHHRMFVDAAYGAHDDYRRFWDSLRRGEYQAGEFKRIGKGGRAIWIQASYNPIAAADGSLLKVVKFATDITSQVELRQRREAGQQTLNRGLDTILGAVSDVTGQAGEAAREAGDVNDRVQTVAAASDQLAASVAEISNQVGDALAISKEAVVQAQETNDIVSQLSASAEKIGEVVSLINGIAGQTNLLALNATIEAARAGEAGRGFAVVASEVKNLAAQTAEATKQISLQISDSQTMAAKAVSAIVEIAGTIDKMNAISSSITTSVQQQTGATREISESMYSASSGVAAINQRMGDIARSTQEADHALREVREASRAIV